MRPYRVYSSTPFYEADEMDINPNTSESMNRYSQTRIGTVDMATRLNRTFIEVSVTPEAVTEPATQKEAVTASTGTE